MYWNVVELGRGGHARPSMSKSHHNGPDQLSAAALYASQLGPSCFSLVCVFYRLRHSLLILFSVQVATGGLGGPTGQDVRDVLGILAMDDGVAAR